MSRLHITCSDELYKKIEEKAQHDNQSISQCVCELLEFALKIEAARDENDDKFDLEEALKDIKSFLELNMIWSVEGRNLSRYLIGQNDKTEEENKEKIILMAKEKAIKYIQEKRFQLDGMLNHEKV